jgi:S1-C subfamily serine protease
MTPRGRTGTVFFITDDGYLISNYHVVKDATKVRLLTGAKGKGRRQNEE